MADLARLTDDPDDDSISASEMVYRVIRRRIQEGSLVPGGRLPEAELAANLGVSRTPVRSALLRLGLEGFVEIVPNRGAFVTRWSQDEIDEIFDVRLALEPYCAQLAADRIEEDAIRRLGRLCDQMDEDLARGRKDGDYVASATHANANFHRIIIDASMDQQIRSLLTPVIELPLMHRAVANFPLDRLEHAWDEHREIVRALANGDARFAEAMMRTHIMAARELLKRNPGPAKESPRLQAAGL